MIKKVIKNSFLILGLMLTVLSSCNKSKLKPLSTINKESSSRLITYDCNKEVLYYLSIKSNIKLNPSNCFVSLAYKDSVNTTTLLGYSPSITLQNFIPASGIDSVSYYFAQSKKEGVFLYVFGGITPKLNVVNPTSSNQIYIKLYKDGVLFMDSTIYMNVNAKFNKFRVPNRCQDKIISNEE